MKEPTDVLTCEFTFCPAWTECLCASAPTFQKWAFSEFDRGNTSVLHCHQHLSCNVFFSSFDLSRWPLLSVNKGRKKCAFFKVNLTWQQQQLTLKLQKAHIRGCVWEKYLQLSFHVLCLYNREHHCILLKFNVIVEHKIHPSVRMKGKQWMAFKMC